MLRVRVAGGNADQRHIGEPLLRVVSVVAALSERIGFPGFELGIVAVGIAPARLINHPTDVGVDGVNPDCIREMAQAVVA